MNCEQKLGVIQTRNDYCLFDKHEINNFSSDMLSPQYWQELKAVTGSAQGRGTTWFVQYNGEDNDQKKHWVLRHYYRGGLIGRFINDSYFFTGYKNTRAAREFDLLAHMQSLSLPTPKPIAYRITRHGLYYSADLLSSRIENAQDLVAILIKNSMCDDVWFAIGVMIRKFHEHGIYHHDLNAHNILIDNDKKLWLIDFDQGEVKIIKKEWQQNNLQRLLRSFNKEKNKQSSFNWVESNWKTLIKGYNQ